MLSIPTAINLLANSILSVSSTLLLIAIFGNPEHPVWNNPIKAWICKLGMTATCCGSILNIMTLSTPNMSEILLNCGLSATFCWLSICQWEENKRIKELTKRKKAVKKTNTAKSKFTKTTTPINKNLKTLNIH